MTHLRGYSADSARISELMDEKLVRANVGVLWFQIEVSGHPVHVREMGAGANAIDGAYRVIGELRKLEAARNERKAGHPHFDAEPHPINLNFGKIEGGEWASSVPAWCRVDCRISLLPGVTSTVASGEIQRAIESFARGDAFLANNPPRITFNGFFSEGYVLAPESDAEAALGEAHRLATGEASRAQTSAAYLDARVYALYDNIPALCYGPSGRHIHGSDEPVSLDSVRLVTKAMALFIASWCGLEPVQG